MDPQEFAAIWGAEPSDLSDLTCERISVVNRWFQDPDSPTYLAPSSKVRSRLAFVHFIFMQWRGQEDLPCHLRLMYDLLRSRQRHREQTEPLPSPEKLDRLKKVSFAQYFMEAWSAERSDLSDLTGKGMDTVNRWFMSRRASSYRPPPPEITQRLALLHHLFTQWRSEESLPAHLRAVYELLRSRQRQPRDELPELANDELSDEELNDKPSESEEGLSVS